MELGITISGESALAGGAQQGAVLPTVFRHNFTCSKNEPIGAKKLIISHWTFIITFSAPAKLYQNRKLFASYN